MASRMTNYITEELSPRFWHYIPTLFPNGKWKFKKGKWVTSLHYDGTTPTHPAEEKSQIRESNPHYIWDNGRQGKFKIIDVWMELNNLNPKDRNDLRKAVKILAPMVGAKEYALSEEEIEAYNETERQRKLWEESLMRQREALFSPEGAAELNYMRQRGWSDAEIKAGELGFITPEEAQRIGAQPSIGRYYTLSIPLRSGGNLYGFKFRTISTDGKYRKYSNLMGTEKGANLFNLTGIYQKNADARIVVVEGELDALHAKVRGIPNVVATIGGKLEEELLNAAIRRGFKRVTLLLDRDNAGKEFVEKSIDIAWRKRVSVLIATFPEEKLPDGTQVHDIDEFLRVHSSNELRDLISNAKSASMYRLESLLSDAHERNGEGEKLRDEIVADLKHEVYDLRNKTPNPTERDNLVSQFCNAMEEEGVHITEESVNAVADEEEAERNALLKKQKAAEASREIDALLKEGRVDEALTMMGEASSTLKQVGIRQKYEHLLTPPSSIGFAERMRRKPKEVPTPYKLQKPRSLECELFTLPAGAITFIVAPTSHGKSTFLQNIALQVAQHEEGNTLYFTFEEDADSVTMQLLNKYIGKKLCKEREEYGDIDALVSNNLRAIQHYYRTGSDRYIVPKEIFHQERERFMNTLYNSEKLRVYYEDFDSSELIQAIRYICSQKKVNAVFVDYIQLLSTNGNRLQRNEELKEICKGLKDLSIETQLPIVVAAQTNRTVVSPLEMYSQKIAEAADLERIANKVLFVWNTAFKAQCKTQEGNRASELKEIETRLQTYDNTFSFEKSGKVYVKLTKNRGGIVGVEAVLNFDGNTGIIAPNAEYPAPEQGKLQLNDPLEEDSEEEAPYPY